MAIKDKKPQHEKSALLDFMKSHYKIENLGLGFIAVFALAVSLLILTKAITVSPTFPVLGKGSNSIIFAWFMLVISCLGILLVLFPYIYSAVPEAKKITWSKGMVYWEAVVRAFIFIIFLTLLLLSFDVIVVKVLGNSVS